MIITIWILSIVLFLSLIYSIDYKIKYYKLKTSFNSELSKIKNEKDAVENYLDVIKKHIENKHAQLFNKKDRGFYVQDLTYKNVANKIQVRVYIKKENEYENGMFDISYDKTEILYNHTNALKTELVEWITKNFIKTIENDEDITWLILKNHIQIDRKNKLEVILEAIEEEEENYKKKKI